ncbi:MAG: hypothetical protein GC168_10935 [Candidatus Hydrogenedens sp.]|nr:hypothetical protein [Candidatus Hydrogenedens sp.]
MAETTHEGNRREPPLSRFMRETGYLVLVFLTIVALFSLGARYRWYFELAPNFQLVYFGLALFALALLSLTRSRRGVVLALMFAAFHGWQIAPYVPWSGAAHADTDRVRVMLANVLTINQDYEAFREEVERHQPDILCVQEVGAGWKAVLEGLRETYPYQRMEAREDNFGIALASRWPLHDVAFKELGGVTVPAILATVETPRGPLRLLDLHTIPPMFKHMAAGRNRQLAEAAQIARDAQTPFALVGDLNMTPWSPYFSDLIERSGLVNTRLGRGPMPTWPVSALHPVLLPIDHVLVSNDINMLGLHRGGRTGSDHLPVIADLQLPRRAD